MFVQRHGARRSAGTRAAGGRIGDTLTLSQRFGIVRQRPIAYATRRGEGCIGIFSAAITS